MSTRVAIIWCCLIIATGAVAQSHEGHKGHHAQPYAGFENRTIKALSAEEVTALESGSGMGFAQAAELNHYPGPKHVLEMGEELGLTATQQNQARKAFDEMNAAAVNLGAKIVAAEKHLDAAFANGSIDADQLDRMTAHIAAFRGQLRAVHLRAHLAMKEIMTPEQIGKYDRMRGYGQEARE